MDMEPAFCCRCGKRLFNKDESPDGWAKIVACSNGHYFEIIYGDPQGGSSYCEMFETKEKTYYKGDQ